MANVMELLRNIKTAIYGRDVRQSIYDAILQCYKDATGNPESIAAHTGDTNNPHNVTAEQVGLANAAEDISQAQKDISGLKNPEFEDFTADGSTPPDARAAIAAITSKMSFFTYLSKVKAALMGLVTLGEMRSLLINNGLTTEAGKYFLDAAYGKTLADLVASNASAITQLNSEIGRFQVYSTESDVTEQLTNDQIYQSIFLDLPSGKYLIFAGANCTVLSGYPRICLYVKDSGRLTKLIWAACMDNLQSACSGAYCVTLRNPCRILIGSQGIGSINLTEYIYLHALRFDN